MRRRLLYLFLHWIACLIALEPARFAKTETEYPGAALPATRSDDWLWAPIWTPMLLVYSVSLPIAARNSLGFAYGFAAVAAYLLPLLVLRHLLLTRPARLRARGAVAGVCVRCGYDLTGNVSGTCPECGRDIRAS